MENINTLAVQVRETGLVNGWDLVYGPDWDSDPDIILSRLAMIHSEICEAHIAKHVGDKDALAAELADIMIRTLDLAGGLTEDFAAHIFRLEGVFISDDVEQAFNNLHQVTTYALEAVRNDGLLNFLGSLALLFRSVEQFAADAFDIDVSVAVPEKMEVNRHRSYRHGGKRV